MRNTVARALHVWDAIEAQIGGLFLLASVVLYFAQIVLRFAFNIGISGIYDLATFSAIFSVLFTASLGVKRNIHARIDILSSVLPSAFAFALEIAVLVLMLIFSGYLLYSGYLLVEESLILGDSTLGAIRIPMWIPHLIMPTAGFLLIMRTIERFAYLVSVGPKGYKSGHSEIGLA